MLCHRHYSTRFLSSLWLAIEAAIVRFSVDEVTMQNLVYREEEAVAGARMPLGQVRRTARGMLCDAGVVSRSADGSARVMTAIMEVFGEFGLTVSEKKTETFLMRVKGKKPAPTTRPPLISEAAEQRYAETAEFRYMCGLVNEGW